MGFMVWARPKLEMNSRYAGVCVHCVLTHNNVSKSVEGFSVRVAGIVYTMTFLSTVQGLKVDP